MGFLATRRRASSLRASPEMYIHTARSMTTIHADSQYDMLIPFMCRPLQMCLRINNLHTLITIFPSLESHLHSTTRTEPHKPATAFGYISSDVGDQPSPLHRPRAALYNVGMSLRSQADKDRRGLLVTSSDHSLLPRGTLYIHIHVH